MYVRKIALAAIPVVDATLQVAQAIAPAVGFGLRAFGVFVAGMAALGAGNHFGGETVGIITGIAGASVLAFTFWKTWPH